MYAAWGTFFSSLRNKEYRIDIYKDGTGSEIMLTLAAEGITLQTDNDNDALAPSRVTTGYLRILNENNLEGIIPENNTQHYVEIKDNNENDERVLFAGYQQSIQFDKDAYLLKQIVELPLIDSLGAMASVKMDANKEMRGESFAELIYEACTAVKGIKYIYYPKAWTDVSGKYYGWLNLYTNRMNWFERNDSESMEGTDLTRYNGISYLELLEEIAKLMGWTVTQRGNDLVFMSLTTTEYQVMSVEMLYSYTRGGAVTPHEERLMSNIPLSALPHAGVNNTTTLINGYKRVSVIADVNPRDDLGIGLGVDAAEYFGTYENRQGASFREKGLVYRSRQKNLTLYKYELESEDVHLMRAEIDSYEPDNSNPTLDNNTAPFFIDTQLEKYDSFNPSAEQKVNWDFPSTPRICLRYKFQQDTAGSGQAYKGLVNPVRLFRIDGGVLHQQSGGCIDMKVEGRFNMGTDTHITARAILKIGKYYWRGGEWQNGRWTGTQWSTQSGYFTFDMLGDRTATTKTLDMPYAPCEDYVIPLPDDVYGEVTFELYTFLPVGGSYQVPPIAFARKWWINDVTLTYVDSLNADSSMPKDSVTYGAQNNNSYKDNKSISLTMATKTSTCKNGLGILMYGDHLFKKGDLLYGGQSAIPEKVLLDRMKSHYDTSKTVLSVVLRDRFNLGSQINWNGKNWAIIGCTINMTEDSNEYKLIEI